MKEKEIKNILEWSEKQNAGFTWKDIQDKFRLNNKQIGFGGKHGSIYYTEIDLDSILGKNDKYKVSLWPSYPPQIEDMTLQIPEKTYVGEVVQSIKSINNLITKIELSNIFENNFTFNIEYQHPDKTLTDSEVKEIRNKILTKLKEKFGISIKE